PDEGARPRRAQAHGAGGEGPGIEIERPGLERAARHLDDQSGDAIERGKRALGVGAALEAAGGVRPEPKGPRGPADRCRIEPGALEEYVPRRLANLAGAAADDSGQRHGPPGVCDHARVGPQPPLEAVEGLERLGVPGDAPDYPPLL